MLHSPASHHPLVSTAPGKCSLSLSIAQEQIRAGNRVRGAVLQGPGLNWFVEAKGQQDPATFTDKTSLGGAQGSPHHSAMSSGITISILSLLQRAALLSAVCSGGSSCARSCASGHKNICLDPWSYSSSLLNLYSCRYLGWF